MRNDRGITLIVLIVTVLIMLALLTVSVSFVFNENGLIGSAKEAKNQVQNQIDEQNKWTQNIIDEF